jgi:hypothetical protein
VLRGGRAGRQLGDHNREGKFGRPEDGLITCVNNQGYTALRGVEPLPARRPVPSGASVLAVGELQFDANFESADGLRGVRYSARQCQHFVADRQFDLHLRVAWDFFVLLDH